MDKDSQYRPESIRGKQPRQPNQKTQPPNQTQTVDDTSVLDVIKAPFQGALHGLLNTGIRTRQQLQQVKKRKQQGLPPLRYKKPPHVLNPFRRVAYSWFKDICENKPLK